MHFELLSIFPEIYRGFLESSLIGKALQRGVLSFNLVNIRDFAEPPHFHVDDAPFGGGAGMLMKPEPLVKAIEASKTKHPGATRILLSPRGERFSQQIAKELSTRDSIILISARYEGVDQRVSDLAIDREISVGDYVLMGGEIASMIIIEAVSRLLPDVIGNSESVMSESFSDLSEGLLECPQYTRPAEFRGLKVPEELLSGDHKRIADWREKQSVVTTRTRRPDLIRK